ncbi:hypothetical protein ABE493_07170 [Stenotrophomonas terrae]|uniref:hypothetical protein n=1 Tax=Stenotrophomonas terrae TaxID=405446 RepID=UPI003208DE42
MWTQSRALLVCALVLTLVGCCDEAGRRRAGAVGTAPELPGMQAAVTEASVVGMSLVHASVEGMVVEPKILKLDCNGAAGSSAEVQVVWRSEVAGASFVKITVGSLTQTPKLWVEGGAAGTEVTGPWINDGSELTLSDGSGRILATIRAEATACSSP